MTKYVVIGRSRFYSGCFFVVGWLVGGGLWWSVVVGGVLLVGV